MVYHLQVLDVTIHATVGKKSFYFSICIAVQKFGVLNSGVYSGLGYNFVPGNSNLDRTPSDHSMCGDIRYYECFLAVTSHLVTSRTEYPGSSASVSRTDV
jgi:hypothetical protein